MITTIVRNNRYIDEHQLKQHILNLLKADNFGLLLGSGSSVSAGGMTMYDLWKFFKSYYESSYKWLVAENFISLDYEESVNDSGKLVGYLLDELTRILDTKNKLYDGKFDKVKEVIEDLARSVIIAAFLDQELWKQSPEERSKSISLKYHIRVLQRIKNIRKPRQPSPWIFTTNYDLSVEWSAKSLGMTVDDGFYRFNIDSHSPQNFNPELIGSIVNNNEGNDNSNHINLLKLQGSLTWEIEGNSIIKQIESMAYNNLMQFISGKSELPELLILPGGSMYARMAMPPHKALLRYFEKFLEKPNPALFIVGYGFNDRHINQCILSALSMNRNLNLVIYYPQLKKLENTDDFPEDLKTIIGHNAPNITIIGGGKNAFFDAFSRHLPVI